ncbi:MAG: TetR family transcriptional regulator [Bacteroidetes bacterium]|nr:MAG: TetR family transcriptional regulator [Bacteroidota bacterium]
MKELLSQITIKVNEGLFLKNPDSSDLGRRIISNSIELIEEIGIEAFTFKKLGDKIGSPECTIYRYFENKQKILLYLTSWYWCWLEYRMVFATANISNNEDKLIKAIEILTEPVEQDDNFTHVNEYLLNKIVISESSKSYYTKEVDADNADGVFTVYKRIVQRVSDLVMGVNPDFKYPHMLVSIVIEGAHQQRHFAEHLPALTDVVDGESSIMDFFIDMVLSTIKK